MIHTASTATNAVFIELLGHQKDVVKVLILGNNPIELATIYNNLRESRDKYYIVDVCFNLKDGLNSINKNRPDVLLLDDNMDYDGTKKLVKEIKRDAKVRNTQIILMKSTNWNYNVFDNVEDYLLKESINSEILDTTISNNMHRHKHQAA